MVEKNIGFNAKIMPVLVFGPKVWDIFTFRGGHFETPRWPPYLNHFYGYQTVLSITKYKFRHQDQVCVCSRTNDICTYGIPAAILKMSA